VRLSSSFETADWKMLNDREKMMQEAERVRMLYVALTRARDHLVVGCSGSKGRGDGRGRPRRTVARETEVDVVDVHWQPATVQRVAAEVDLVTPEQHRLSEEEWIRRRQECWWRSHRSACRPLRACPCRR